MPEYPTPTTARLWGKGRAPALHDTDTTTPGAAALSGWAKHAAAARAAAATQGRCNLSPPQPSAERIVPADVAAVPRAKSVASLAGEYLSKRALSLEITQRAGITAVPNAMALSRGFKTLPCLAIPYIHPLSGVAMTYESGGEQRPFVRIRYLAEGLPQRVHRKEKEAPALCSAKGQSSFCLLRAGHVGRLAEGSARCRSAPRRGGR